MPESARVPPVYQFGPFRLEVLERRLLRGGDLVPLAGKPFDTLVLLVEGAGTLQKQQVLIDRLWPDVAVEQNNLQQNISLVRRALGGTGGVEIETVRGQGYRLLTEVREVDAFSPPEASPASDADAPVSIPRQRVHFCTAGDKTRLAYARSGNGPPLVKAANWLSHLEFDHKSPVWRHWWRELANRYQLIRYDTRGGGLSDWEPAAVTFDAWVEDLRRVVESTGVERFALFGMSQGVSVAVAYAAKYPERISHLILYGGFVRGQPKREDPRELERASLMQHLIRVGWGDPKHAFRQVFGALSIPDGTNEQFKWFDELQRASMSASSAAEFARVAHEVDLRPLLREIRVPTLVIHANRDAAVPFAEAKIIAGGIPDAKLKVLDGNNHILFEHEPAWPIFLEEIDAFIASSRGDLDAEQ